jgi:hypothetical protein
MIALLASMGLAAAIGSRLGHGIRRTRTAHRRRGRQAVGGSSCRMNGGGCAR